MNSTEYTYPSQCHDYRWVDDYGPDKVPAKFSVLLHEAICRVRPIVPLLGIFTGFECAFVTGLGRGILGRYINGTMSYPYVALSRRAITKASEAYDVDVLTTLETTITHELGHAVLDALGVEQDEDLAEALARVWWEDRKVAPDFVHLLR